MDKHLSDYVNAHKGQVGTIVGRGPSLEHLRVDHIAPGPIIALNSAIVSVQELPIDNTVYSLQRDGHKEDMVRPHPDVILILQRPYSSDYFPTHPTRVVATIEEFGFGIDGTMSILVAIRLLKFMGVTGIIVLCCDNLLNGSELRWDSRAQRIDDKYAHGYLYTNARNLILNALADISHELILPGPRKLYE